MEQKSWISNIVPESGRGCDKRYWNKGKINNAIIYRFGADTYVLFVALPLFLSANIDHFELVRTTVMEISR